MNNQETTIHSDMSEEIIKAIETDKVKMIPKWHFVMRWILLIVGTVLASLTLLYFASFIFFILRQTGSWFVPSFGPLGWYVLLTSLPRILILVAIIFIAIVAILIKKYSFVYGRPLLYSALGIILFTMVGGFLLALTPFHSILSEQADADNLPLAGGMYRKYSQKKTENLVVGDITKKTPEGYSVRDNNNEVINVVVTPKTKKSKELIDDDEEIVILGERHGNTIEAVGIERLSNKAGIHKPKKSRSNHE